MRHFLASTCFLAFAGTAAAEPVTHFTLGNGMEVVVIEDHRAAAVVQMVWYRIGSADEPKGHSGIAHFLEHLLFKGTDDLKPGEFSATVENLGGDDNAFTSYDYTSYFQNVAAPHLETVMKMESDRMRDLQLSEDEVLTERQVILEERGQTTESDPGSILGEQMAAALYLNHPYGTPVIGWRHEMEQLSLNDAVSFYRANYAPNNAILVVAGDVTPDQVRDLAQTYYGVIPKSDDVTRQPRATEPPQVAERRVTYADERVSEPYVVRNYLAPERNAGDQKKAAALTILAELLGGDATTAYLARKLQFGDKPVAIWSGAGYDGDALDSSSFSVYIQPVAGVSLADAESAMDGALADFLKDGVDAAHLERIKTQVRAGRIYAQDSAMGRAMEYGSSLVIGLTLQDIEEWPNILAAVTEEDIMTAAAEVLDRRRSVTGWLTGTEEAAE